VFPGIVGMHNHLYYSAAVEEEVGEKWPIAPPGYTVAEIPFTAPRIYLASGVTTMRTTGIVEPYTDLSLKQLIDANKMPGPKMDATAPYLEAAGTLIEILHQLRGPDDARKFVAYWADNGTTSDKAYMAITREATWRRHPGGTRTQARAHRTSLFGYLAQSHSTGH
jgi:imidazolonepropionase-like amidohydrolase